MIRFHIRIKYRFLIVKSNVLMLESMRASGNIDIEEIFTISDLVPEIKYCRPVRTDKLLGIYEISDNRLHTEFLDELSPKSFFTPLSSFESTSWEAIKSTSP